MIKKIFKFMFMSLVIVIMLVSCKKHQHSYKTSVIEPTCLEQGYTLYTCSCGDTYKDDYTDKTEHNYQNGTCVDCGKVEPHTHQYTSSIIAPTCTEEGYTLYICSCGDTYKDHYTDKINHHYTPSIVEPTCTEEGYTVYTCSCGDTYKDHYTDKVPHSYQDGFCIHCGEREIIEYDVTFVLNYQGATTEVHSTEQGLITFVPTREGYVFNGWWMSEGSIGDEYILSIAYDMAEPVTKTGLILYAEWVEKPTEAHQLQAPSVSIKNNEFSWKAVPDAQSYTIQIYQNNSKEIYLQRTIEDTHFLLDMNSPAGVYQIKVRANGDGIHTVNSSYVVKYYPNHILSNVSHIQLDMTTSVLSFEPVKHATEYQLYVDNQMIETLSIPQYDLSAYEAGTYTIQIVALAEGYQSSTTKQNIMKRRLLTPTIEMELDQKNISYTLNWNQVSYANQYILHINGQEIRTTETNYVVDMASSFWQNETMEIFVQAFDIGADYLISTSSHIVELTKLYRLELHQNIEEAGTVSSSKVGLYTSGEEVILQAITNKGYIFDGWYEGEKLLSKDEIYQFLAPSQDMVYTAKWTSYTITTEKNIYDAGYMTTYNEKTMEAGETITLEAGVYLGYVWNGWYNGETLLTTDFTYTFDMPNHSIVYTAKYTLREEMADFTFTSSTIDCTITGLVNSNITEIVIPEYVTEIRQGAFRGCLNIKKMTLPFIGGTSRRNQYFGYLFGANTYQRQKEFIPESIEQIVLTQGETLKEGSFYQCNHLVAIYLPNTLTSIENNAFYQCSSLVDIIIPEQTQTIGNNAFYGCSQLTKIELPDSVTSLGDQAFYNCYQLSQVILSEQLTDLQTSVFYGCGLQYHEDEYGKYLGSKNNPYMALMLIKNSTATNIVIPSGVKLIRKGILTNCRNLTHLTIPFVGSALNHLNNGYIGYLFGANSYNENNKVVPSTLKEVTITGGQTIPFSAISGCKNITHISIIGETTLIDVAAFSGCSNLNTLTLSKQILQIEESAFNWTNIENLYYLGSIEDWCNINVLNSPFANVDYLHPTHHFFQLDADGQWTETTSIEIPTTITEIGRLQFEGFDSVTHMAIPNSVKKIGYGAFRSCTSLNELIIPDSVDTIDGDSLAHCRNLKKLVIPCIDISTNKRLVSFFGGRIGEESSAIPSALTEIEITNATVIPTGAFQNCEHLITIKLSGPITQIENHSFAGCSQLTNIVLPEGLLRIGEQSFASCSALQQVHIPNSVTQIESHAFQYCSALTDIVLSNQIQVIESHTFSNCIALTQIILPEGVTKIYDCAFFNCTQLQDISIPDCIAYIEGTAFTDCNSLKYNEYQDAYYLGNSEQLYLVCMKAKRTDISSFSIHHQTKMIYAFAFANCSKLSMVFLDKSLIQIGNNAFENCTSLWYVWISDLITYIGSDAFKDCKATEYRYDGTMEEWKKITDSRVLFSRSVTISCTDGTLDYKNI